MKAGVSVRVIAGLMGTVALIREASYAQPSPDPLPPAAAGILAQMDKDIAVTKTKAVIALEKVLRDTTKKGDLAGAVAIKETIDQLKTEKPASTRGAPARITATPLVGRWKMDSEMFEIFADGSAKQRSGVAGTWKMDATCTSVTWAGGITYRLRATPEGAEGVKFTAEGQESKVRFVRVP